MLKFSLVFHFNKLPNRNQVSSSRSSSSSSPTFAATSCNFLADFPSLEYLSNSVQMIHFGYIFKLNFSIPPFIYL